MKKAIQHDRHIQRRNPKKDGTVLKSMCCAEGSSKWLSTSGTNRNDLVFRMKIVVLYRVDSETSQLEFHQFYLNGFLVFGEMSKIGSF